MELKFIFQWSYFPGVAYPTFLITVITEGCLPFRLF